MIAYGWESQAFYAKWFRRNDLAIIRQLQGPILNPGSPQSELAPFLLEKVRDVLLADPAYIARLKRHYRMFKEKVDPKHFDAAFINDAAPLAAIAVGLAMRRPSDR